MAKSKETDRRRWRLILTIITLVALGALIYFLRRQIFDTVNNLGRVNTWALLLMLPAQMLNYHSYARLYQSFFKILGHKIGYRSMLRTVSELNFVNSIFPSGGISGFSYFGLRMKAQGFNTGMATLVQMMRFVSIFISFQLLLFLGLFVLAIGGQASHLTVLVAGSLATLLVAMTFVMVYVVSSQRRIKTFFTFLTQVLNRLIHIFRPRHPETISIPRVQSIFSDLHENYKLLRSRLSETKKPLLYALLANIAELTTIYVVYVAFGYFVNPGAVIIAYAVANFAGLVSVLPGGVGIYEVLMTAVLATAGVPPGISIPVTVMYRILNLLIQLPAGYYFYHKTVTSAGAANG